MNWIKRHFYYDQWHVGVIDAPIESLLSMGSLPEIRWLPMPRQGVFLADPFLVRIDEQEVILCEAFDYRVGRGRIAAIPLARPAEMEVVLDPASHVSFPFPVEHSGHLYCIPETSALGEVGLYEVTGASTKMRKVATLLDGVSICDSAVFLFENRWWLLGTDLHAGKSSFLCAWYADELLGPWKPHPRNPIKRDIASSRSAGTPFVVGGSLYRPSQDCSGSYGKRVVINRVSSLTPDEFKERAVAAIEPDCSGPFANGLHTISSGGSITLVDGKERRSVFSSRAVFAHRCRRLGQMVKGNDL